MSQNLTAARRHLGPKAIMRSTFVGAGGALAAGTGKAAGLLGVSKAVGLGALAGGPVGAAVAVGLMTGLIYVSAAARSRMG
ncbi:hypothetical protein [Magnetospirillum sp. UT-4]|uniref:hypothetical protein n=1 Tax=Magnetospirillum sp. UT-4 TaxID=2681467 RepID=UPI0013822D37|nr:hypothetical protein [Magnetospirillum sp. UT-4]CAA7625249.1 conserved exported hypothetical protein [Magnetospirillum sp. UT-4]